MKMNRFLRRPVLAAAIVLLCSACSTDPEVAKREYLESGNRYFEQKKYSEAVVQYRNALQQDARFGEARLKLAQTYEAMSDVGRAAPEYIRAADALPKDAAVQVKAATFLLVRGQFEDARARAQGALKLDPKNVDAQIVLGNALAGLKDFDAALEQLEEASRLDPASAAAYTSLGAVQLARGSRPDAEAAFRKAIETNPKLPMAHMALANYLWAAGKHAEAEQSLKDALALDAKNLMARRALATLYMATRRTPEAEVHLRALADADKSPGARFRIALADYYVAVNRPDDAMKVLEHIAAGGTGVAAARTREATIEYTRKNPTEAHRVIDDVLAKAPKNVPALLVKARFLADERKIDEALTQARAAAAAEPSSVQAHYLLGILYRAKHDANAAMKSFNEVLRLNPRAVAAQVQLSQLNLARGARQPALQLAQDASKALPRNPAVALNLVKVLIANGDTRQAEAVVSKLLAAFPKTAVVHEAAGALALRKRDHPGARRAFTKALELDADNVEALAGLVALSINQKKPEEARALVEQRLSRTPDDGPLNLLAAQVYATTGDRAKAEAFLRKTIDSDADNLKAYAMLAQLYTVQRRLPEARASLESIVKQKPDAVGAHTLIAMLYQVEGKVTEARQRYERILQIDPGAAVAANNLGFIYAEEGGNLDVALQLAQTAKAKLPDVPEVDDTLGLIYLKKNLPSLAVPLFEQAAAKDPKNATYHYRLGLAAIKAGDVNKGKQALEQVIKLNPAPELVADARKALEAM